MDSLIMFKGYFSSAIYKIHKVVYNLIENDN